MEVTEREVTERLKATDAEDRKRNQEYLAHLWGSAPRGDRRYVTR